MHGAGRLATGGRAMAMVAALVTAVVGACGDARTEPAQRPDVIVAPLRVTATVGQEVPLTARVIGASRGLGQLLWASADPSIATVDAQGHVVGARPGVTDIMVALAARPDVQARVPVAVRPCEVAGPVLSPTSLTLEAGATGRFALTVVRCGVVTDSAVTWSVVDSSVARVDSTGLVTARRAGVTALFAASRLAPELKSAVLVTVTAPAAAGAAAPDSGARSGGHPTTP